MSTKPLQLEAHVGDPEAERARQFHQLRMRVAELTGEVEEWRDKYVMIQDTTTKYERSIQNLREKLEPLYTSLRMLFGDLDVVAHSQPPAVFGGGVPAGSEKWESWKRKLGGKAAEFITELLIHGEMSGQQLKVATRCGQQTVYDTIAKLNKAQLLDKNGGKYRLKEI